MFKCSHCDKEHPDEDRQTVSLWGTTGSILLFLVPIKGTSRGICLPSDKCCKKCHDEAYSGAALGYVIIGFGVFMWFLVKVANQAFSHQPQIETSNAYERDPKFA